MIMVCVNVQVYALWLYVVSTRVCCCSYLGGVYRAGSNKVGYGRGKGQLCILGGLGTMREGQALVDLVQWLSSVLFMAAYHAVTWEGESK